MVKNLLFRWHESNATTYEEYGYRIEPNHDEEKVKGTFVDVIGGEITGRICFWPPDVFEFQFYDLTTNDVCFLETKNFSSENELDDFVFGTILGLSIK